MTHHYHHLLQHKHDQRERLKRVEEDRLVRLVSHPSVQLQPVAELSSFISRWWYARWNTSEKHQPSNNKLVVPET